MKYFLCIIALNELMSNKIVANRFKRGNEDNFHILLDLYKMNPLKRSKVFKKFSSNILLNGNQLVNHVPGDASHFDSGESVNGKDTMVVFKMIEDTIHVTHTPIKQNIGAPDYIANSQPENFDNDSIDEHYHLMKKKHFNRKFKVTKMLPVKKTVSESDEKPSDDFKDDEKVINVVPKTTALMTSNERNELTHNFDDVGVIVMR